MEHCIAENVELQLQSLGENRGKNRLGEFEFEPVSGSDMVLNGEGTNRHCCKGIPYTCWWKRHVADKENWSRES